MFQPVIKGGTFVTPYKKVFNHQSQIINFFLS